MVQAGFNEELAQGIAHWFPIVLVVIFEVCIAAAIIGGILYLLVEWWHLTIPVLVIGGIWWYVVHFS